MLLEDKLLGVAMLLSIRENFDETLPHFCCAPGIIADIDRTPGGTNAAAHGATDRWFDAARDASNSIGQQSAKQNGGGFCRQGNCCYSGN